MPITNKFNRTRFQQFVHNIKLILIGILLAVSVASFLYGNMQAKARNMEREQYKQELDSLKALAGQE